MSDKTLKKNFSENKVSSQAADLIQVIVSAWQRWQFNARTRRQLAKLTTVELRDVGISCYDANVESQKTFWQS